MVGSEKLHFIVLLNLLPSSIANLTQVSIAVHICCHKSLKNMSTGVLDINCHMAPPSGHLEPFHRIRKTVMAVPIRPRLISRLAVVTGEHTVRHGIFSLVFTINQGLLPPESVAFLLGR